MSSRTGKALGGFHYRVIRWLMRRILHQSGDGTWTYPPLKEAMEDTGLKETETFFSLGQNTVNILRQVQLCTYV